MSKELNKAPVEQAGGDERVKCAVCVDSGKVYDISGEGPWKCYACTGSHEVVGYANGDELDNMLDDRTAVLSPVKTSFHTVPVYREARDALEQPSGEVVVTKNESGAIVSVTRQDKEGRVLSVIAESQPSPVPTEGFTHFPELLESVQQMDAMLKAEAERPEVAEVAFVLRNIGAMDAEDIDGDNVDLRFEDAEGRDTGCDVSIVEYAEKAADLFEQHDRIVGELRADRDSWAEQAEQRLADWDEMRKERDAALAEVKRIKTISDNYYALCVERQQQLDAALAMVSGLRSLLNPILCYVENDIERMRGDRDKSDNKETYDLAISLAMKRLKAAQHAVFTTEPGCNTAVELASHITAQAQHSAPEEFIGRLSEFLAQRGATGKALLRELRALCAAAPGKEVGHE